MQIKDVDKLKAWLLSKLEPLCDADPVALAKYVVALLRKEKPKSALKDLCIDQLEVFLSKETAMFVEKLFRCLETESYMKGEDPPKTPPIHLTSSSSASSCVAMPAKIVEKQMNDRMQSSAPSKADNGERRPSEDFRRKEVDDDDRDFRRSRRHDCETTGGGGMRRIIAPIQVNYFGGGGVLGKKRTLNSVQDGPPSNKRRTVIDHSRMEPEVHHRSTISSGVSSTTAFGGLRRSVRDRLGPRPDNSKSEQNSSRRKRIGRSSSSSSSGSSSDSDSDSSTGSSEWSKNRKSRKTTNTSTGNIGGGGGMLGVATVGEDGADVQKKQRCKDYDRKGFCILGESCPYDHGLDPLVIGGNIPTYGHPPSAIPGIGVPTLHPPSGHEILVPPIIPPNITGRLSPPNSKSESYNPEEPGLSSSSSPGFIPIHIAPPPPLPLRSMFPPPHPPHMSGMLHPHLPPFPPPPPHHPHPHFVPPSNMITPGGFHRPRHPFIAGNRGPSKPSDALIVRKIPKELNTITKLSSHFEKFGTIVNLTVRYEGDLEGALVQFSLPTEAKKAHDNTEAVLNNRFIKVYYLRRDCNYNGPPAPKDFSMEGPVSVAVSAIAVHPITNSFTTSISGGRSGVLSAAVSSSGGKSSDLPAPDSSGSIIVAENVRQFGRTVISSQDTRKVGDTTAPKTVTTFKETTPLSTSSSVTSGTCTNVLLSSRPRPLTLQQRRRSAEAAKKNLELQKRTQELLKKQIDQQKELISKLEKSGKSISAEEKNVIMTSLKSLSTSNTKLKEAASKTVLSQRQEQQKAIKEQLVEKQRSQLKLKAEALRKEAHKLGLISSPSQSLPTAGKGKGNNSVDARNNLRAKPRQLLVMGAKEKDQLITYFESYGGLDSVEVDPSNTSNLIFTFRNSSSANQVVKNSTFKGKPLIMKWYQPKPLKLPTPTATTNSGGACTIERAKSDALPLVTPTLTKLDPQDLHLVEDSEDEEDKGGDRAWRR